MTEITFRSITPVHNFAFEQDDIQFLHSGNYKSATYSASLKKYERTTAGFHELMRGADEWAREHLVLMYTGAEGASYYLVVDIAQPLGDGLKVPGNTFESMRIPNVMIDTLRLHSSKGLLVEQTYQFQLQNSEDMFTSWSMPSQYTFGHLGFPNPSVLPISEFDRCRQTFDTLLRKVWNDNFTFDRLLKMALEYHKATFSLVAVEHSFLLLMVVFEALFKNKTESNASQAAVRIAKLLSESQNHRGGIQKTFFDNNPHSFCNIRNDIAHGDPNLDLQVVKLKYPMLYQYITKAMLQLVVIPDGTIDHTKDYYGEISKFIDKWFVGLPVS